MCVTYVQNDLSFWSGLQLGRAVFVQCMKRTHLLLLLLSCASLVVAQTQGYYRVKNSDQGRYISVIDNRGELDYSTNDADLGALQTIRDLDNVVSDPSTIVYFEKLSGNHWDLHCQGVSVKDILGISVNIIDREDGTYQAGATKGTVTKYLGDEKIAVGTIPVYGEVVTNSTCNRWYLLAPSGENYFGLKPSISAGGSYYQTFYAEFPFTFSSTGMNAYYVTKVDESKSAVVISDAMNGAPSATPVIVKCSSQRTDYNKLNIGGSTSASVSDNKLTGVYFCNDVPETPIYNHRNVVVNNPSTMRVLGTASDGSLAFVKSTTLQYIPANTAYITVSSTAPDVLKVYTQTEYDALPDEISGDLNGDNAVNVGDLALMVKMILGSETPTSAADLNNDGNVNVGDLAIIVKTILNNQ